MKNKFEMGILIGKTVLAIKGSKNTRRRVFPEYILFDDKKTYIQLEEQDYYTYHDCSGSARTPYINQDKEQWKYLLTLPDANEDI